MSYCKQCKINSADPTTVCPLCQSVLEKTEQAKEGMYPMIGRQRKGRRLMLRIFAFLCLIAMVVLAIVNYVTYNGVMWSIIGDAGILYLLVTLRYTLFNEHEGHTMKMVCGICASDYHPGRRCFDSDFDACESADMA